MKIYIAGNCNQYCLHRREKLLITEMKPLTITDPSFSVLEGLDYWILSDTQYPINI